MYVRKYALRFSAVFLTLFICLVFFILRLILIQVFQSDHLAKLAEQQHNYLVELEPIRGTIYDRKMRPLALNVSAYSLFANPRDMSAQDKREAIAALKKHLNLNEKDVQDKLSRRKYFVWLERKIPKDKMLEIKALKIHGLDFLHESKRYYPNKELAAHILGFSGIDNEGLEGIELQYNRFLKGAPGQARILRDAKHRELLIEKNFIAPKDGYSVILTIDETIQYLAERSLENALKKFHAKAASIIVVDVRTGEILALANQPTYDLGNASSSPVENRTNRAISFIYEPGSVFKIVTASAALEEGKFTETDKIFCENGAYRIANHILHDHHPHGTLSFREVFEQSSNIGVAKIAQKLGPDTIYKYGQRFRFGIPTDIDLKGEVRGVLKPPSQWSKTTIGAIPMGHEVTVTPLQLVYAMAAIANDGVYMRPLVVKSIRNSFDEVVQDFEPQVADRIISSDTARRVTEILVGVTEKGTGGQAKIKGIRVAGKTGTAQKIEGRTYSHDDFYASFIGFAPADDPKLAAVVVFDDPHPFHFGGTVAAPVFREVIGDALKYLANSE